MQIISRRIQRSQTTTLGGFLMSRQIKSVSLLPRHMQIAERMPNFSSFVQEALDSYAADIGQGVHTYAP